MTLLDLDRMTENARSSRLLVLILVRSLLVAYLSADVSAAPITTHYSPPPTFIVQHHIRLPLYSSVGLYSYTL